jgi:hypothetical protein
MTASAAIVPDWPPMGTNQLSGASEGSRVIVMWASGDGPYEYTIHRESGRVFGQSASDLTAHLLDRAKELTFVDRVWAPKD